MLPYKSIMVLKVFRAWGIVGEQSEAAVTMVVVDGSIGDLCTAKTGIG